MKSERRISSGFRLDVPRFILEHAVRSAPRPLSLEMACLAYRIDCDGGTIDSIRGYAHSWGWSKRKVEENMELVRSTVAGWGVAIPEKKEGKPRSAGQFRDSEGDKTGTNPGQKQPESFQEEGIAGQVGGQFWDSEGDKTGTASYNNPTPPEEYPPRGRGAHAREGRSPPADSPFNPQVRPPTEQEVRAWAALEGIPPDAAWDIAESLSSLERPWHNKHGQGYGDWRYPIRKAWERRQRDDAKQQKQGATGPQLTHINDRAHQRDTPGPTTAANFNERVAAELERKRQQRGG